MCIIMIYTKSIQQNIDHIYLQHTVDGKPYFFRIACKRVKNVFVMYKSLKFSKSTQTSRQTSNFVQNLHFIWCLMTLAKNDWSLFVFRQGNWSFLFSLMRFLLLSYLFNLITFPSLVLSKMDFKAHTTSKYNQRLQEIEHKTAILMVLVGKSQKWPKKSKTAGVHKNTPLVITRG